jgi:hypothetical protein
MDLRDLPRPSDYLEALHTPFAEIVLIRAICPHSGGLLGQACQRVELLPEPERTGGGGGGITDSVKRLGVLPADTDTDGESIRHACAIWRR